MSKTYTALRITLSFGGKPLFDHLMLLLTNRRIENAEQACQVYKTYILRFKIEVIFRFLKQNMGWQTFQVRVGGTPHFNAIANLLALVFFLVGYFKELEEELSKHPLANFLCKLAFSKGKLLYFSFYKALENLHNIKKSAVGWKGKISPKNKLMNLWSNSKSNTLLRSCQLIYLNKYFVLTIWIST